jgi:hypothetical protein
MTHNLKRLALALAVALLLPEWRAHADLIWDFSYTVSNGSDTTGASGTLTTTSTPSGGPYTVTGITGTWTFDTVTESITGVIAPGYFSGNNNLLSPSAPHVGVGGISFSVPSTTISGILITSVNIFYDDPFSYYTSLAADTRHLRVDGTNTSLFSLTPASTTAVPEPSNAIVAVCGAVAFIAHGWFRRRDKRRQVADLPFHPNQGPIPSAPSTLRCANC